MVKKLYVGNLPYSATEQELEELFSQHGNVDSVAVVMDRETGQSRGFGFVEMEADAATTAMTALNGSDMGGRSLRIDFANDRRGGGGGSRW